MYMHYTVILISEGNCLSVRDRERGCINDSLDVILNVQQISVMCARVCAQIVMHAYISILHWDMDNWTNEGLVVTEASRDITDPSTYWVVAVQDVWLLDGVYLHTGLWVETYWII